jgi:hypothetical protein
LTRCLNGPQPAPPDEQILAGRDDDPHPIAMLLPAGRQPRRDAATLAPNAVRGSFRCYSITRSVRPAAMRDAGRGVANSGDVIPPSRRSTSPMPILLRSSRRSSWHVQIDRAASCTGRTLPVSGRIMAAS